LREGRKETRFAHSYRPTGEKRRKGKGLGSGKLVFPLAVNLKKKKRGGKEIISTKKGEKKRPIFLASR